MQQNRCFDCVAQFKLVKMLDKLVLHVNKVNIHTCLMLDFLEMSTCAAPVYENC